MKPRMRRDDEQKNCETRPTSLVNKSDAIKFSVSEGDLLDSFEAFEWDELDTTDINIRALELDGEKIGSSEKSDKLELQKGSLLQRDGRSVSAQIDERKLKTENTIDESDTIVENVIEHSNTVLVKTDGEGDLGELLNITENTSCNVCHKSFSKRCNLLQHIRVKHSAHLKYSVKCDYCPKEFNNFSIKDHLKTHLESKVECDVCKKLYTRKNFLHHKRIVHGKDELPAVICSECGKTYNSNSIKAHSKTHTPGTATATCDVCGKEYSKRNLLAHIKRAHTDEDKKVVFCVRCAIGFDEKTIRKHVRSDHILPGLYQCYNCPEDFSTWKELSKHRIRAHSKNVYPCDVCGDIFADNKTVMRHMASMHSGGEDSILCEICNKVFASKYYLKTHCLAVHEDKPTTCNVCGKHYRNRYLHGRHVNKYHGTFIPESVE